MGEGSVCVCDDDGWDCPAKGLLDAACADERVGVGGEVGALDVGEKLVFLRHGSGTSIMATCKTIGHGDMRVLGPVELAVVCGETDGMSLFLEEDGVSAGSGDSGGGGVVVACDVVDEGDVIPVVKLRVDVDVALVAEVHHQVGVDIKVGIANVEGEGGWCEGREDDVGEVGDEDRWGWSTKGPLDLAWSDEVWWVEGGVGGLDVLDNMALLRGNEITSLSTTPPPVLGDDARVVGPVDAGEGEAVVVVDAPAADEDVVELACYVALVLVVLVNLPDVPDEWRVQAIAHGFYVDVACGAER